MFCFTYSVTSRPNIFAYQHKLEQCLVNRQCTISAVLGLSSPRLCPDHARHVF